MKSIQLILLFYLLTWNAAQCQQVIFHLENNFETEHPALPWLNDQTRKSGNAHSGNYFSHIDSIQVYGGGYKGSFPEICIRKNIGIVFNGWFRTNGTPGKSTMAFAVSSNDSSVFWQGIKVQPPSRSDQDWFHVSDTIKLPANICAGGNSFSLYFWNEDGKSMVDLDDWSLDFFELRMPGWLVPQNEPNDSDAFTMFLPLYKDSSFLIEYDKMTGHVRIGDAQGHPMLSFFSMYLEWTETSNRNAVMKHEWSERFFPRKDSLAEEGTYLRLESRNEISTSSVLVLVSNQPPSVSFRVNTQFSKKVFLNRSTVVLNCAQDIREVFTHSSLRDSMFLQKEYWLGKEGLRIGSESNSMLIYHPASISSLQADVPAKRVLVNFDAAFDHPLLRWPLLKVSSNYKLDYSSSTYSAGEILRGKFTIYKSEGKKPVPRFMQNPSGFTSAMVWTEHADYGDLRTQKAVSYGADSIQHASDATGGFVYYKIPVTKSVFYSNPEKIRNKGFGSSESCSITGTTGFAEFLDELQTAGNEIVLHTPDPFTTRPEVLEEAMGKMKNRYHAVSWIDHGYDNAKKSNREDLVCDGLDSTSKYYAAGVWKKYGLKYLWNCFFEDSAIYTPYAFNSSLTSPYPGWGEAFPVPDYWQHPTRSGNLVHWRTGSTTDFSDGSWWNYFFNDSRLNDLINQRGTCVIHCYPARVDSTNGFYMSNGSTLTANPEFNNLLSRISRYRDQGELYIATIRDLLDYRMALENVEYTLMPDGAVKLHNHNKQRIENLSMCIASKSVKLSNGTPHVKQVNNDLVFWFNLEPDAELIIIPGQ